MAEQDISFQAMRDKMQRYVNIVMQDPAVDTVTGFAGGGSAAGNYVVLDYKGSHQEEVREAKMGYVQQPGEILFAQSGGGGGWGDALERDPAAVLRDYLDEYVSPEAAKRDYGVVIDVHTQTVDEEGTRRTRAALKAERGKTGEVTP